MIFYLRTSHKFFSYRLIQLNLSDNYFKNTSLHIMIFI